MGQALDVTLAIRTAVMEEATYGGGGLLSVFETLDVRSTKFLEEKSLYDGLQKLNVRNITRDDVALFFETIDDNGDGKISYMEFSRHMSECDEGKTIDDPYHHLFPLFDDLRRRLKKESLSYMFQIKRDKNKKQLVRWDDFLSSLQKQRPADLKHYQKELYQLLDVKANHEHVDFDEFVALVGLNKDSSQAHQACHHMIHSAHEKDPTGTKKKREDSKFVMRLLISRGVRVAGMR